MNMLDLETAASSVFLATCIRLNHLFGVETCAIGDKDNVVNATFEYGGVTAIIRTDYKEIICDFKVNNADHRNMLGKDSDRPSPVTKQQLTDITPAKAQIIAQQFSLDVFDFLHKLDAVK